MLVVVEEEVAVESDGELNGVDVAGVSIGKSCRLVANHWGECTRSSDYGLRALVFQFGFDRDAIEEVADLDLQNA